MFCCDGFIVCCCLCDRLIECCLFEVFVEFFCTLWCRIIQNRHRTGHNCALWCCQHSLHQSKPGSGLVYVPIFLYPSKATKVDFFYSSKLISSTYLSCSHSHFVSLSPQCSCFMYTPMYRLINRVSKREGHGGIRLRKRNIICAKIGFLNANVKFHPFFHWEKMVSRSLIF